MGRGGAARSGAPLPMLSALLLGCSDPSLHLEGADLSFARPVYQIERMIDGTLKYRDITVSAKGRVTGWLGFDWQLESLCTLAGFAHRKWLF